MGLSTSKIPDRLDKQLFIDLLRKHNPLPDAPCDPDSIFSGLCRPEGYVDREEIIQLALATDVFLSHEWGYDESGRSVHDTVGQVSLRTLPKLA
jgi:hypothetical protein